ncbi:hypothetical protein [Brevundimonas intermedia]|uniref:hypothetical protein n=1 Tax=Brevundimonas intermedia TaxID=74315 RepID=UPI003209944C
MPFAARVLKEEAMKYRRLSRYITDARTLDVLDTMAADLEAKAAVIESLAAGQVREGDREADTDRPSRPLGRPRRGSPGRRPAACSGEDVIGRVADAQQAKAVCTRNGGACRPDL